mmetsp:Transcript_12413/g.21213  ORF Transcript_12413/g.21213 Transcript_12413/m.21213 type:complete len:307 (-) Transcript_12413:114-1034(-)|eukprot:CAMPEP_0184694074 /NCGR_PEP_ID=MMETSP0313-20130426/2135_1 /TAXON_ID=2792 /ORGANISM="Porphyridium aerugineum, Strain SAG 1380-2" /LENGTH=306 /DNA_ID=CAMNT_0027152299 /DNA_START=93 /DNA_END=1013 /DNA_ORIENTATION=+
MENYHKTEVLGQGTYGKVYKATHIGTGKTVALKKTLINNDDEGVPPTTLREVSILRTLESPYVVSLLDVEHTISRGGNPLLYLVFEYLDHDLKQFMVAKVGKGKPLDMVTSKNFTYQVLLGLRHCHANSIMHRDLKPQNLLVTADAKTIKIADFGLGRVFSVPVGKYTHEIVTLWYRAPEILLGTKCYSTAVDMWSVGCILAEMVHGRSIFCGETEIEQLFAIFRIMGTPSADTWQGLEDLRDWHDFPKWKPQALISILPQLGEPGCDLLLKMLALDPAKRISANEALRHPWFDDIRDQYAETPRP